MSEPTSLDILLDCNADPDLFFEYRMPAVREYEALRAERDAAFAKITELKLDIASIRANLEGQPSPADFVKLRAERDAAFESIDKLKEMVCLEELRAKQAREEVAALKAALDEIGESVYNELDESGWGGIEEIYLPDECSRFLKRLYDMTQEAMKPSPL